MKVQNLCRQYGISDATYYKWKSKYGGIEAADIKRLREIEEVFFAVIFCPEISTFTWSYFTGWLHSHVSFKVRGLKNCHQLLSGC